MNQEDNEVVRGLLYVKVTDVRPVNNQKFGKAKLFIKIADHTTSLNLDFTQNIAVKNKISFQPKMFSCASDDKLELQFSDSKSVNADAELQFSLKKLIQMPRVKHIVKTKMIKTDRKKNSKGQLQIQNLVEVDLEIIYLNNIQGMFVIETMEVQLTRDTQIFGKMDPFIVLTIGDSRKVTKAKNNEGKNCVWAQKFELQVRDSAKTKFQIKIYDKDPVVDDLIGQTQIQMLRQNLLIPSQKLKEKDFDLYFKRESAGIIKIQYRFDMIPFNY